MSKDCTRLRNENKKLWNENEKCKELLDKNKIARNRPECYEMDFDDILSHHIESQVEYFWAQMLQQENEHCKRLLNGCGIKGD